MWISVEEQLPELNDMGESNIVIGIYGSDEMSSFTGWYNGREWRIAHMLAPVGGDSHNAVTHWMPLPEPPGEK